LSTNNVIFKGSKDGIVIMLNNDVTFEELKESLKEKSISAKSFFGQSKSAIIFKGRELTEEEEMTLLDVISKSSGLNISFVINNNKYKKNIPIINRGLININENITHFHKGALRSGMQIDFKGSVVVMGDVNPGGEIIADGNVIILGTLKGVVHAGRSGEKKSYVAALSMRPTQLRIANLITYFPENYKEDNEAKIAFIEDDKICVKSIL